MHAESFIILLSAHIAGIWQVRKIMMSENN